MTQRLHVASLWLVNCGLLVGLALGCVAIGCGKSAAPAGRPVRVVRLALDAPVGEIEGYEWPPARDLCAIEEPVEINLRFPGGLNYRAPSQVTLFSSTNGLLSQVTLTPLPELVEYEEGIRAVEEMVAALGVADEPRVKTRIQGWRENPPESELFPSSRTFGYHIDEDIELFAELKHHVSGGGWYVSLQFTALRHYRPKADDE